MFTRAKIAVFIDGCFWHGCPIHYRASKSNVGYWDEKIAKNRHRDQETSELLTAAGWTVMRFWSHEDPALVASQVQREAIRHASLTPAEPKRAPHNR